MSDPLWLQTAKTLPAGRRTRIMCCANDKSMLIENGTKGYRGWCFRCEASPFVPHGDFSIADLKRRREELAWTSSPTVTLPKDFTTDIPASEAVWLFKSGIHPRIAKHYGFGYSPSIRRIILPVYKDGKLQGYTARSTINERPKYVEKASTPDLYFRTDPRLQYGGQGTGQAHLNALTVVTEDILSAVRVGCVCGQAYAAMGTTLHSHLRQQMQGNVVLWLDPDRAGRKASRRMEQTLKLVGNDVRAIRSDKDPKYYSNEEIRRFLLSD